jgi:hypothetical protein
LTEVAPVNEQLPKTGSDLNPYEELGRERRTPIVGALLRFNRGDYIAGQEGDMLPPKTKVVAVMPSMLRGWQKWEENRPTDAVMGLVGEGFVEPKRIDLGDHDKAVWDLDGDGEPRDPWQLTFMLIMIDAADNELYTFVTSSGGGMDAMRTLGSIYGQHIRLKPDELPVLELDVGGYQHRDRSIGRVKTPKFNVVGWVNDDKYIALAKQVPNESGGESSSAPAAPETVF